MLQTQSQKLVHRINKNRKASQKVEEYLAEVTRNSSGTTNNNLTKLLRIKNRRKQPELQKTILPSWKKSSINSNNSKERFSFNTSSSQKNSDIKKGQRNSHYLFSDRQRENISRNTFSQLKSSGKKHSVREKQELQEKEQSSLKKLFINSDSRRTHLKHRTIRQAQLTFKKMTPMNKTSVNFTNSCINHPEEDCFVGLISKFKFQNLKTRQQPGLKSRESHSPQNLSPSQSLFSLYKDPQESIRDKKWKKTEFKLKTGGWKGKEKLPTTKMARKVSVISPWQNESRDLGSTTQLL